MRSMSRTASARSLLSGGNGRGRGSDVLVGAVVGFALLNTITYGVRFGFGVDRLLGLALGAVVTVVLVSKPMLAIGMTYFVVPISVVLLSALLRFGVPPGIVRLGALGKDAVAVALFIAGLRAVRRRGDELAPIDRAALLFLGLVVTWFVLTPLLTVEPLASDAKVLGLRSFLLFPMVFLGIRWLSPDAAERRTIIRWALWSAIALALVAVYERFRHDAFVDFLLVDLDVDGYYRNVAGLSGRSLGRQLGWLLNDPIRAVSLLLGPFSLGDTMVTGYALGAAGLAVRWRRRLSVLAMGVCALATFFSGTRINMVAIGVVTVLLFLDGRAITERVRLQVFALGLLVVLALTPTVLGSRLVGEGNEESNEGHRRELTGAVESIVKRPLGHGLGADGAVSRRLSEESGTVSGNTVLSVGVQAGVVTMVVFVVFLALVGAELVRRRRRDVVDDGVRIAYLVLLGSMVAITTHQGWTDTTSGGYVWATIALGLGISSDERGAGWKDSAPRTLPRG